MLKRQIKSETYLKMGCPDLGDKIYLIQGGKKVYGKVGLLSFTGFKGSKDGDVLIGLSPFKKSK